MPPSSLDLSLVNFLLWSTSQPKLYHQLKRIPLTLTRPINKEGDKTTDKKGSYGVYDTQQICYIPVNLLIFIISTDYEFWGDCVQ